MHLGRASCNLLSRLFVTIVLIIGHCSLDERPHAIIRQVLVAGLIGSALQGSSAASQQLWRLCIVPTQMARRAEQPCLQRHPSSPEAAFYPM